MQFGIRLTTRLSITQEGRKLDVDTKVKNRKARWITPAKVRAKYTVHKQETGPSVPFITS